MVDIFGTRGVPVVYRQRNPFWSLQHELDKAMSDFYNMFNAPKSLEGLKLNPSIDIVDSKDRFKVVAEMPGMGEEDIKVSINEGILTIRGEKETSKQDKDKNYLMKEITYGSYERHIPLPDFVDVDKANATFKKGMLWIEIPKKSESVQKNRELKITKA